MAQDTPDHNTSQDLKFKQICLGEYTTKTGSRGFVVVALSEDGHVYQSKDDGWVRFENRFGGAPAPYLKSAPRSTVQRDTGHTSDPGEPPW